jgi:hypothetical protein
MIVVGYYVFSFLGAGPGLPSLPAEERAEHTSMKIDRLYDAQSKCNELGVDMPYTATSRWCHMVREIRRWPRPGERGYESYMDDMLVDQSY